MNDVNKIEKLCKRFDSDANLGFELQSDSEDFFNKIENPFMKKIVIKKEFSSFRFLLTELFAVVIVIIGVKLIYSVNNNTVVSSSANKNEEILNHNLLNTLANSIHKSVFINKNNTQLTHLVFSKRNEKVDFDSLNKIENSIERFVLFPDSIINSNIESYNTDNESFYRYNDNSSYYSLKYINNLITIDYTDSFPIIKKIKPILTGTPAMHENKTTNIETIPSTIIEEYKFDYQKILTSGIKNYTIKNYTHAIEIFEQMIKDYPNDQNACFYCGLSYFELKNYSKAIAYFQKLKQINHAYFEQEADYFLGLSYKQNGQNNLAASRFKKIVYSNSFYIAKAKYELEKLR